MHQISIRHIGGPSTPHDVQRLRRNNIETLQRFGQPVIWKHAFTEDDLSAGGYRFQISNGAMENIPIQRCPACWDEDLLSSRGDCNVCYGNSFTSIATDDNLFIDERGYLTENGGSAVLAPKYRGYGPSVLTWTIQPDVPEDVFRISDRGVLTRVQTSMVSAPWTPDMADNDLIINVSLGQNGYRIDEEIERHILKQVSPQTVRGYGRAARARQFKAGQQFEMTKLPLDSPLYQIRLTNVFIDDGIANVIAAITASERGPFQDASTAFSQGLPAGNDIAS